MVNKKYELHMEEIISKELISTIDEAGDIWNKICETFKVHMYSTIDDGIKDAVVYIGGEKQFIQAVQIKYTIDLYELPEEQKADFKCFLDKIENNIAIPFVQESSTIIACDNGFFRKYLELNKKANS